jgi:RIO-like serine/threonine protein kinase
MPIKSTILREPYYHREHKNDTGPNSPALSDCLHVALLIMPNFCKPLSQPLALAAGTLRTWTSWSQKNVTQSPFQLFSAVMATAALSATFFKHPLGTLLTTVQDLTVELSLLVHEWQTGQDYKKLIEPSLHALNNALYLATFFKGRIELTIASMVLQISLALYKSYDEFIRGNRVKGSLHICIAALRSYQLKGQVGLLQKLVKKDSEFTAIKKVGQGSSGKVFKAERKDKTLIALKRYFSEKDLEKYNFVERVFSTFVFRSNGINKIAIREFELGQKFNHPNIVKVFDYAVKLDASGNPITYLIMEYIDKKSDEQDFQGSVKNSLQLIDALKTGFRQGYIYCDFHDGNVLIDSKGDLKLIDLDSFEKLSTIDPPQKKEHLYEITEIIEDFLELHENSEAMEESIKEVLKNAKKEKWGQNNLPEKHSAEYFIYILEKIETVLNSFSEPSKKLA